MQSGSGKQPGDIWDTRMKGKEYVTETKPGTVRVCKLCPIKYSVVARVSSDLGYEFPSNQHREGNLPEGRLWCPLCKNKLKRKRFCGGWTQRHALCLTCYSQGGGEMLQEGGQGILLLFSVCCSRLIKISLPTFTWQVAVTLKSPGNTLSTQNAAWLKKVVPHRCQGLSHGVRPLEFKPLLSQLILGDPWKWT